MKPENEGILYIPAGAQPPPWYGRKAPAGLKTYPAWSYDPTARPTLWRLSALVFVGFLIGFACGVYK